MFGITIRSGVSPSEAGGSIHLFIFNYTISSGIRLSRLDDDINRRDDGSNSNHRPTVPIIIINITLFYATGSFRFGWNFALL